MLEASHPEGGPTFGRMPWPPVSRDLANVFSGGSQVSKLPEALIEAGRLVHDPTKPKPKPSKKDLEDPPPLYDEGKMYMYKDTYMPLSPRNQVRGGRPSAQSLKDGSGYVL